MKMQALFPIYFSRARQEDTSVEDYDIAAAQNEDNLNQNLNNLYKYNEQLESTVTALQNRITELETMLYEESDEGV